MKQKALAIFIGLIMVLSAFAGFVMRGGNGPAEETQETGTGSLTDFGVAGRLVEWPFTSVGDLLEMCPDNLIIAYWIDLERSQNLTEAVRATISPNLPNVGLSYGESLETIYSSKVERVGVAFFDDGWTEFHWMVPARVGYEGLVIPYENFMIIPWSTDYSTVMGRPTLFGPQKSLEKIIDVVTGGASTDRFSLPYGEMADFQLASLGRSSAKDTYLPLDGGFQELYIGVSAEDDLYTLIVKCISPLSSTNQKLKQVAMAHDLKLSTSDGYIEITGTVPSDELDEVLGAFLAP